MLWLLALQGRFEACFENISRFMIHILIYLQFFFDCSNNFCLFSYCVDFFWFLEQILWKLSHQWCYYYRGMIFHCMYISFVLWLLRWQNIHIWFNYRPISRDEHSVIMLYRSMTLAVSFTYLHTRAHIRKHH